MNRIKAILLLLLFSFSLTGNSFELHYCKGELTDVAFWGEALCVCEDDTESQESCHVEGSNDCHEDVTSESKAIETKSCCETDLFQLNIASDFSTTSKVVLSNLFVPFSQGFSFFNKKEKKRIKAYIYVEPDIWVDIPIKIQSFLI